MLSRQFWKAAAERAIKTFAQTLAALLTPVVAHALGTGSISWDAVLSAVVLSGLAAAYSLVTSVGSTRVGDSESPSLVRAVPGGRHSTPTDLG